ncbi:hypothetical protein PMAYCL1PPCAC_00909, partial [Pristionchus mayeri]
MLPVLLLCVTLASGAPISSRTPEGCTIGERWTEKFIRFECFKGDGAVVKGVKPIGCVPMNTETGDMIDAEETFNDEKFTYQCKIQLQSSGDIATYTIINCLDAKKDKLAIGESRVMEDGREWSCFKDDQGAVKLAQELTGGCIFDGVVIKDGKTWTRAVEFKATVNRVEKKIGKAETMRCVSDGKGGFVAKAFGCVTDTGIWLRNKGFSKVREDFVQCLIDETGKVTMEVVDQSVVSCDWKGTEVKSGESKTVDGNVIYCKFGKFQKTGCEVNGQFMKKGLAYIDGKAYHCWDTAGLHHFGELTGCTDTDGSIKQFHSVWRQDTQVMKCHYVIKLGKVTTSILPLGCAMDSGFNGEYKGVKPGALGVNGGEMKICAQEGKIWKMRELTEAELEKFQKRKPVKETKTIIGGEEGRGEGAVHEITGQCKDLLGVCTSTEPFCADPSNETSSTELIEMLAKMNATFNEIRTILEKAAPSVTANPLILNSTAGSEIVEEPVCGLTGQCPDLKEVCTGINPVCEASSTLSVADLIEVMTKLNNKINKIKIVLENPCTTTTATPEVTTQIPEESTTVPTEPTTGAPEVTTQIPEESTTVPTDPTTGVPEVTTQIP